MNVNDIPINKNIKTICPMTLPRSDGPFACCEFRCAWWRTYYKGTEREYGECGIMSLTCLQDIII